ncbi:MAG TPA: response regulator [Vicinamibacterales bacterium]
MLRRACEVGLRKRGYDVVTAADGQQGLDLALTERFDAILLDMLMPRLSGLDVLRGLRERGCDVPVLVLSNSSRPGDRLDAEALGAAGYVVKAALSLDRLGDLVAALTNRTPASSPAEECR